MFTQQDAICTFGDIDFLPTQEEKKTAVFYFEALGNDSSFGDPENTLTQIESQLIEGATIGVSTASNRTITITIQVCGINSAALAIGEQELVLACKQDAVTPFRFLNPDRAAAITVYDILYTHITHDFKDLDDERLSSGHRRRYTLTMTAKPWPRSETEAVYKSGPPVDATVEPDLNDIEPVSDGTDTDNWVASSSGTSSITYGPTITSPGDDIEWTPNDGNAIWAQASAVAGQKATVYLTRNVALDTSGYPYLRVRGYSYQSIGGVISHAMSPQISGARWTATPGASSNGAFEYTALLDQPGVDSVIIYVGSPVNTEDVTVTLAIDQMDLLATAPVTDTASMRSSVIDVVGTELAEPAIALNATDEDISLAMVYTASADQRLAGSLLPYRDSGPARIPDPRAPLTSAYSILAADEDGADTFNIPVRDLTEGTYQIAALLAGHVSDNLSDVAVHWQAQTAFYSTDDSLYVWDTGETGHATPELGTQGYYTYAPLGDITLPLRSYSNAASVDDPIIMKVWSPKGDTVADQIRCDAVVLFNMSTGHLTVVDPELLSNRNSNSGSQTPSTITIEAPTSQSPVARVWEHYRAFSVDAGPNALARGVHSLTPPASLLWTATNMSAGHTVKATYLPRWLSYANFIATLRAPSIATPANGQFLDTKPTTLEGGATAGNTVVILLDGVMLGTTIAEAAVGSGSSYTGSWSYPIERDLPDGTHIITIYQSDDQGHSSKPVQSVFTLDRYAPDPPVVTSPSDSVINYTTISTVEGTAEAFSTVTVTVTDPSGGWTTLPAVVAAANGTWSTDLTAPLAEGESVFTAIATDQVGHVSDESEPVTVTVDLTAPEPPVITSPTDRGVVGGDFPTITGTGEPGATISVRSDTDELPVGTNTTTVAEDGTWSTTVLVTGDVTTISAAQRDLAGNRSEYTQVTVTVDLTAPEPPVITGVYVNQVTGTGETGATVSLTVDGVRQHPAEPVTVVDGAWSFPLDEPLSEGSHTVTATQTDPAGNTSDPATWTGELEATTATNLALDPSFELGESSEYWDVGTSGAEWVEEAYAGTQCLQIPGGNRTVTSTWTMPAAGGSFDLAVRTRAVGDTHPSVMFTNLDGTSRGSAVEVGEHDGWVVYAATVNLSATTDDNSAWRVRIGASSGLPLDDHIQVDAVIVAAAGELTDPTDYFDGDTPDTDTDRHEWTDQPHASTSVRHHYPDGPGA